MLHNLLEADDGLLKLLLAGEVDVVVTLHADTVDRHAGVLHLLHHVIDALALAIVHTTVVIVEQQTIGIGFACKLECLGNELVAAELEVTALAVGTRLLTATSPTGATVVGHSLVHHVPSVDYVLVAVHHGMDVVT